jgi:STE24 endopeptidase
LVFSFVQNTPGLFLAFGFTYSENSPMPIFIGLTLFTQTVWSPVDKILQFLLNINSRANEFAADKYAKDLGMGDALASGLIKISIGKY